MTNTETRAQIKRLLVRYRKALRVWSMAEIAAELAGPTLCLDKSGARFFADKIRACEHELRKHDAR